eukprot:TRINITY_DN82014_c0_g1_i1.p1 TRINITY_DN82014_c0_g1~~TRINITY_DN82014_c0_g1_i1.p1  ORF type:complete len:112 (+),score=2.26 TRINITY_DN82014_c0_g1_i1:219-554(+)
MSTDKEEIRQVLRKRAQRYAAGLKPSPRTRELDIDGVLRQAATLSDMKLDGVSKEERFPDYGMGYVDLKAVWVGENAFVCRMFPLKADEVTPLRESEQEPGMEGVQRSRCA